MGCRYYQLLPGHAAIGSHHSDKIQNTDTDERWWYDSGKQRSRHHLFVHCTRRREKMWKEIGNACKWKHPRTPSIRLFWEDKATDAVLRFVESTGWGAW